MFGGQGLVNTMSGVLNREEEAAAAKKKPNDLDKAVWLITDTALRLIQEDPHQWSARPCQTCRSVSTLIKKPFGCVLYAQQKGK